MMAADGGKGRKRQDDVAEGPQLDEVVFSRALVKGEMLFPYLNGPKHKSPYQRAETPATGARAKSGRPNTVP